MTEVMQRLKNEQFKEAVLLFIKQVGLVYSRKDKRYMTNEEVNYSSYTAGELITRLEIQGDEQKLLFKKLIQKHALKTDVALPKLLFVSKEETDET